VEARLTADRQSGLNFAAKASAALDVGEVVRFRGAGPVGRRDICVLGEARLVSGRSVRNLETTLKPSSEERR
jgi:hypothetical protein